MVERKGSGRSYRGRKGLKTRVKTARKRSNSSTRWLDRQLNDPYVEEAKKEGMRSRAAFKLIEINDQYHLLRTGRRIIDLGAAPGGWSQVCASRIGAASNITSPIVAIDCLDMEAIPGVNILTLDFRDEHAPAVILECLKGKPDLILSDMAAPTTGHRKTDHLRTVYLFEIAADFAMNALEPGGDFLAKVFRGGAESSILGELKRQFSTIHHIKPPASRQESPELYVLARGFHGGKSFPS